MGNLPVVVAAALAFLITALLGFWLVPLLRRIKYGQTILDIGPKWHKSKQGTPTMGGILFVVGVSAAVTAAYVLLAGLNGGNPALGFGSDLRLLLGVLVALAFGSIGFIDDYIKVVKRQNLGLSAPQKMVMQLLVASLYLGGLYLSGDRSTIVLVPFLGQWNLGFFYYPLAVLGVVYLVNAVNLTDGVDGLCASVTFVSALGFLTLSSVLRMPGMGILAAALAGGCLGFLLWNFYPAKIFMGDTGSLFLGGLVVALAFGLGLPVYLLFLGFVYIVEGLTVMIQVAYFKATRGKRLFKMTPVHHHFEMSGWRETKIVLVFSAIQLALCVLAVWASAFV